MSFYFYAFWIVVALVAVRFLARVLFFRRLRRWRGRGPGSHFALRGLFRRLGTRPEQEQAVLGDADALAAEIRALREDGRALREEVAALLEAPALDRAALDAAVAARLAKVDALRGRAAEALARLHAVLDEGQRRTLAGLLRGGLRPAHAHAHGCRRGF
ncbi:MAG TPA: periplasmic heavy metal sensor [Anaeromyxobacteraceae bacterium]|jgi:hypothetical protein